MHTGSRQDMHTGWWLWVQRRLDGLNWSNADLARAARQYSTSVDESVISRWRNRHSLPEMASVRAVAQAFGADIREAMVEAGLITEEELRLPVTRIRDDLSGVPDTIILAEIEKRMTGSRRKRPPVRTAARPVDGAVQVDPAKTVTAASVDSVNVAVGSTDSATVSTECATH